MSNTDLSGIFPALLTPYDDAGNVNLKAVPLLVEHLLKHGAHGFFICGTTGEFPFLTVDERKQITEKVLESVNGRVPVVSQVGALRTQDVVDLAGHAASVGVSAISSVPPFYYGFSDEAILDFVKAASGATDIPFIYYHIPPRTAVSLPPALVEKIAALPNVVGIKYSSGDLIFLRQLMEICGPEFRVYCGQDEILLPALSFGAHGAVGSTYNFLLSHSKSIWDDYRAGAWKKAEQVQYKANRFMDLLASYSNVAASKEVVRLCGLDLGLPRKPQTQLSAQARKDIAAALDRLDFWSLPGVRF